MDREKIDQKIDSLYRSLFHLKKMESKKYYVCVCCNVRLTANSRRPVKGRSIRLFVATRLFPNLLSTDAYICTKCRLMYNKWIAVPEFCEFLQTIDSYPEVTTAAINKVDDEGEEMEEYWNEQMEEYSNEEYNDDQATDDISDETDLMDDGHIDASEIGSSASDEELFDESPANDRMKDEEMASDENHIEVGSVLFILFSPGLSFFRWIQLLQIKV